jgi:hypothetical protein
MAEQRPCSPVSRSQMIGMRLARLDAIERDQVGCDGRHERRDDANEAR